MAEPTRDAREMLAVGRQHTVDVRVLERDAAWLHAVRFVRLECLGQRGTPSQFVEISHVTRRLYAGCSPRARRAPEPLDLEDRAAPAPLNQLATVPDVALVAS
jgi:hypothetical protein